LRSTRFGIQIAAESPKAPSRLLVALVEHPDYPSDLAGDLGLTRANVSNHLACLRGCGLVVAQPEGRRVRYELADARLGDALRNLNSLVLAPDPGLCPAADGCC
jgi:DNA-binding transcriptional ArsR family regulator